MKPYLILFVFAILFSCQQKHYKYPHVQIVTEYGDIEIELYADKAPETVKAFLGYVDSGVFTNSSFHRTLKAEDQPSSSFKSELIQGGIWGKKNAPVFPGIRHENTKQTGILHLDGTVSLARTDTGTASTEFFICIGKQPAYDYGGEANTDKQGFAAFGRVVSGMDIVKKIHRQPDYESNLEKPVVIFKISHL
ncbi:N/A [soil metagenome]